MAEVLQEDEDVGPMQYVAEIENDVLMAYQRDAHALLKACVHMNVDQLVQNHVYLAVVHVLVVVWMSVDGS